MVGEAHAASREQMLHDVLEALRELVSHIEQLGRRAAAQVILDVSAAFLQFEHGRSLQGAGNVNRGERRSFRAPVQGELEGAGGYAASRAEVERMLACLHGRGALVDEEQRCRAALEKRRVLLGPSRARVRDDDVERRSELVEQCRKGMDHFFSRLEPGGRRKHGQSVVATQLGFELVRPRQCHVDAQGVLDPDHRRHVSELQVVVEQQGAMAHALRDQRAERGHRALPGAAAPAHDRHHERPARSLHDGRLRTWLQLGQTRNLRSCRNHLRLDNRHRHRRRHRSLGLRGLLPAGLGGNVNAQLLFHVGIATGKRTPVEHFVDLRVVRAAQQGATGFGGDQADAHFRLVRLDGSRQVDRLHILA